MARLLGLTPRQVRSLARGGFLRPGRGPRNTYRFSFQDLVLLRAAKSLDEARIPPRRVRRALRELARSLPRGRQLSDVHLLADGERVVVRDHERLWQPESGQLLFDRPQLVPVGVPDLVDCVKTGGGRGESGKTGEGGCHGRPILARIAPAVKRASGLDTAAVDWIS